MRSFLALAALVLGAGSAGAAPVRPQQIHVSPDGTVNELHADGVYRAVPGAAKRTVKPACVCGDGCACPADACPAKCPVTSPRKGEVKPKAVRWEKVCDGKRCYWVRIEE